MGTHSHQPQHHEPDWAAMVADITREGEVLMPYLLETTSWIAALCRRDGLDVRRIIDIGSGPGVGACVLAQQFEGATVIAVDGSQEMLDSAALRAEAFGLSARVRTERADLPSGLARVGGADLVWMAMVLHHLDDPSAALRTIRSLLEPGGLLVVVEFGDPPRLLPDDVDADHPGLSDRLGKANLAGGTEAVDFLTMFDAAGFERVADRMATVHLRPPLTPDARRVALRYLQRMRQLADDQLNEQDRAVLDVLMGEDAPPGIMRRTDAILDVSRQIYVVRATDAS